MVQPLSNLITTNQVDSGDWIQADLDSELGCLIFTKEAECMEMQAMARMLGDSFRMPPAAAAASVQHEVKTIMARSSKK